MPVELLPITDPDLIDVGLFFNTYYPTGSGETWGTAWRRTVNLPGSEAPNHGFMLKTGGAVVGALAAIYSTRLIGGRLERFCNLAVWCVAPAYRLHSVRMLQAVLAQKDYHFTDLIPGENVRQLDLKLGFKYLDTLTYLTPNLPWWSRVHITASHRTINSTVSGSQTYWTYYHDHKDCLWTNHLLIMDGRDYCYLQWRKQKHFGMKHISLRYVSHPDVLRRHFRALGSYFLFKHRCPFTLAEERIIHFRPRLSIVFPRPVPRLYKSPLAPDQIDYLYSEITSAP
jgi:hypothetical protein